MGLDMYLTKKTYVKNWDHYDPSERNEVTVIKGGNPHPTIKPERVSYIVEEVAYWRKFNALHKRFVERCQYGVDDCRESYVDESVIEEILADLKRIKAAHESGEMKEAQKLAQELLPSQVGFFFGVLEYNEWYFKDVYQTIEIFEELIKEGGDFYYRSSW